MDLDPFEIVLGIMLIGLQALVIWLIVFLIVRPKKKQELYDSGELKCLYYLKKGKKTGQETIYYRTGEVNKIRMWKKDELSGGSIVFYRSGEKYIVSQYKNNALEGEYTVYHKNGTVLEAYNYNHGEKVS
jgi:antitoxin component YwqK of YwqJK toxin-antitoxin module